MPVRPALGYLDSIVNQSAGGWAYNPDGGDAATMLDVFIDDEMVGETVADLFRDDLLHTRDGYAAFEFPIPLGYFDGREHSIRIVIRGSGEVVENCPLTFRGTVRDMPFVQQRFDWAERTVLLQKSRREPLLMDRIREQRKVALLATFHSAPKFLGYHYALTKLLTDAGFVVLVMHSAGMLNPHLGEIDCGDCFLYCKRNLGYDFGSWATGIYAIADLLAGLEEMVLINDSIIGLQFDIAGVLEQVRRRGADLVGLTDSYERAYHLQSYFLWLGPRICRSSLLEVFMARYPFTSEKEVAIKEGEVGLSRFLLEHGFTAKALYPYEQVAGAWLKQVPQLVGTIEGLPAFDASHAGSIAPKSYRSDLLQKLESIACAVINGTPLNAMHFFWDVLTMELGHPFLKREFVLLNPGEVPTYFQLAGLLGALPQEIQTNILEVRQIYGGHKVPFITPPPQAQQSAGIVHRPRGRVSRGGALVA
jgi:hypothetical protein